MEFSWQATARAFALLLLVGLFAAGAGLTLRFRGAVRRRHPQTWQSLGAPELFRDWLVVQRFLWRDDYVVLDDRGDAALARGLKVTQVVYGVAFVVVVLIWGTG